MNALTIFHSLLPRREGVKIDSARTRLTCHWVKDPRSERLICVWLSQHDADGAIAPSDSRVAPLDLVE
jgi:hypothetical protein